MYLWYVYVIWLFNSYLMGMYFSALFPVRFKIIHKNILPLIITLLIAVPAYIRAVYSKDISSVIYQVVNYFNMSLSFLFLVVMYKGKFWKKLMAYGIMGVMICISEMLTNALTVWVGVSYDMSFNHPSTILYLTFGNAMVFILLLPVIYIWKKCIGETMKVNYIGFLIILPVAQFCQLNPWACKISDFDYMINIGSYVGLMLCILSDIILFYILMYQSEKEQLEMQLKKREKLRAIETVRYEELEAKRVEMAKEMIAKLKEQVRE